MSRSSTVSEPSTRGAAIARRVFGPLVGLALLVVALVATNVAPVHAVTWDGRFSVWRAGAFSTQRKDWSCVGATTQIMLNLVRGRRDSSQRNQLAYLDYAQRNSRYPIFDNGADPEGWARALTRWGAGDGWGVAVSASMTDALRTAAVQMRSTRKPVGLLVKHGSHAWVMTGFAATMDPALDDNFVVTGVEVVGPLWPHGTLNGQPFDPAPRTWMSVQQLKSKFDAYNMPQSPAWNGRWIAVVPEVGAVLPAPEPPVTPTPADLADPAIWGWVISRLARHLTLLGWPL